jgi:hypothetical protein
MNCTVADNMEFAACRRFCWCYTDDLLKDRGLALTLVRYYNAPTKVTDLNF